MSSTEQKNVTQHFIASCHTFGILPTILSGSFDNFSLATDMAPFEGIGATKNLGERLRDSSNPLECARMVLPAVNTAPAATRLAPFLLRLTSDATVYYGNQAVVRMCESLVSRRWGFRINESGAIRHAYRHAGPIFGLLGPAGYGMEHRSAANAAELTNHSDFRYLRSAADAFDQLLRSPHDRRQGLLTRAWCVRTRSKTTFKGRYGKESNAVEDYSKFVPTGIHACDDPPADKNNIFRIPSGAIHSIAVYKQGGTCYIKVRRKYTAQGPSGLYQPSQPWRNKGHGDKAGSSAELFVLDARDLQDLSFLLQSVAFMKLYMRRRESDVDTDLPGLRRLHSEMLKLYLEVMRMCGARFELRNKLGVYFDVLQWRYLAWRSGNLFYNHSDIMKRKVRSKGIEALPDQDYILRMMCDLPMDWCVDVLGIYKASIYPEVDPFKVVGEQYILHMNRHRTEWELGTSEYQRFQDTRSYMWYLAVRLLREQDGIWPGRIREGVIPKQWHATYKVRGISGQFWREAHDVDLTGVVVTADISDEQYFRQADSACAPPWPLEYKNAETMKKAPRRHKRKLLYSIQESPLPSLPQLMDHLNALGTTVPDGHVGPIEHRIQELFSVSTDIVTGSRCERHKDAPRPFYAASPPWGCILSYFDGITRDFLNSVPQSMLGKSTRQKFTDLRTISESDAQFTFYMSDDKAKYSPHMDPQSQQLPAEFFAELFDIPAFRAFGPIMYNCELYYRVHGHLVHYNANGTDREGMRGASNTWLEVVAQGLSTRLCREKGLIYGKSNFLSFIDDGLRRFTIRTADRTEAGAFSAAQAVIDDVIFGLRVLGRELSWDKTYISQDMFVMLNELVYEGTFISSGLKSFCTVGDILPKAVMSAADYEQLYFGKLRGAHGVGTPPDLCHIIYIFETLAAHYRMGLRLQDKRNLHPIDYRLFCICPVSQGGAGIRSLTQLMCNEVANAHKEGIASLMRLCYDIPLLSGCVNSLLEHDIEELSPVDFMREPDQAHTSGPRLRTQRLAAAVRSKLHQIANNPVSRNYLEQDEVGLEFLAEMGRYLQSLPVVGAEEVRLIYASSPVAFIDEFVQKLASSSTIAELLDPISLRKIKRQVQNDLLKALDYFPVRSRTHDMLAYAATDVELLASLGSINA